nr:T9SS type A sorting domain-containing protein [Hymenobacter properus]
MWLISPWAQAQTPAWQQLTAPACALGSAANAQALAADANGNVFMAGTFSNAIRFGTTLLTTRNSQDSEAYVAKWNPAGGFMWAQRIEGSFVQISALAVNGSGVYVAGTFSNSLRLGAVQLTNASQANSPDIFIAKLIDQGSTAAVAWGQRTGGPAYETISALAVSGSDVYLVGKVGPNGGTIGNVAFPNTGYWGFVAKLTDAGTSGTIAWAHQLQGNSYVIPFAVAANAGNVYIAGTFGTTATFGATALTGTDDCFVAKLTDTGTGANYVWAQQAGGTDVEQASALAVAGANVYVAGYAESSNAAFGALRPAASGPRSFVAKLTDAGNSSHFAWVQQSVDGGLGSISSLAVSGPNIYAAGSFSTSSIAFGSAATLVNSSQPSGNPLSPWGRDGYVLKISETNSGAAFAWAKPVGGRFEEVSTGVACSGTSVYLTGWTNSQTADFDGRPLANPSGNNAFLAYFDDPTLTATTAVHSDLNFRLSPNPAHGRATVALPGVPGVPRVALTLLDALGRVVRTTTVLLPATGLSLEVDLSALPAGLYALQVRAGGATATRRLLVE